MAVDKIDQTKRFVMGKLAQGKGSARRPKFPFLSYFEKVNLIQLIRSVPLRDWQKLEGLSGVMVVKNS